MANVVCQKISLTINDVSSLLLKGIIVYSPVHIGLDTIVKYVEDNHGVIEGLTKQIYSDTKHPLIDNKNSFLLIDEQSKAEKELCEEK